MNQRVQIYVPGILTMPGDARNWCGRAVTWTHLRTGFYAEKVEYYSTPLLGRLLFQKQRAQKLLTVLHYYMDKQWDIALIGHSNGCDVILDALKLDSWPVIKAVHLVAGACEADFKKNGLNDALLRDRVENVFVYVAGEDQAMRYARTWIGKSMGYGTLGLDGYKNVDERVQDRVGELTWEGFGHSQCWEDNHFDATMTHLVQA